MSLLLQSARWRLLSLLFERPRPGWHAQVRGLAREVGDAPLRDVASHAAEATEGDYLAIFGTGGAVSPREVAYCGIEDPGKLLGELRAYYDAFAFRPQSEDPVDHVVVETGFVGFLKLKQAYARDAGDDEQDRIVGDAADRFVLDHLARMSSPLAQRLEGRAPRYLERAAGILRTECPAPARTAHPLAIVTGEEPMQCGGCES